MVGWIFAHYESTFVDTGFFFYYTSSFDLKLYTDACTRVGFGAISGTKWIQYRWRAGDFGASIDFYEFFAIFAAVRTWGNTWEGKRILIYTDNQPITEIWEKWTTTAKGIMFLVRKLYLFAAQVGFSIRLKFIKGVNNSIADSLSRFQQSRFRQLAPTSDFIPTDLSPEIIWILKEAVQLR